MTNQLKKNQKKLRKKLEKITKILPDAQFEHDNDGQIIVYTNIAKTDNGLFEIDSTGERDFVNCA